MMATGHETRMAKGLDVGTMNLISAQQEAEEVATEDEEGLVDRAKKLFSS